MCAVEGLKILFGGRTSKHDDSKTMLFCGGGGHHANKIIMNWMMMNSVDYDYSMLQDYFHFHPLYCWATPPHIIYDAVII